VTSVRLWVVVADVRDLGAELLRDGSTLSNIEATWRSCG
jgi:hypothetical protein